MSDMKVKLYIVWVKDFYGKLHVDTSDEYPERVTFNSLEKMDGKVDFDLRRIHHLDKFCDEHGFEWGQKEVEVDLS